MDLPSSDHWPCPVLLRLLHVLLHPAVVWSSVTLSFPAGRPRGRGAKAPRLACEAAGIIRISDDSSTESDPGLDSDFNSSPESLMDDDVVIVDAIGLPSDDRGEGSPDWPTTCGSGFQCEAPPASWRSPPTPGCSPQSSPPEPSCCYGAHFTVGGN